VFTHYSWMNDMRPICENIFTLVGELNQKVILCGVMFDSLKDAEHNKPCLSRLHLRLISFATKEHLPAIQPLIMPAQMRV